MLHAIVLVVAVGFAAAIAYKIGLVHGINASKVAIEAQRFVTPLKDQNLLFTDSEPLPQGFNPKTDGGKELDEPVPLVQVEPSYYEYDETGEATGRHRKEFRLGD